MRQQPFANLKRAFQVLSARDKHRIIVVLFLQVFIGFLDLLGVLAIGLLGALTVSSIQIQQSVSQVNFALELLNLSESSFQFQILILGFGAVILMVGRTFISIIFTRRTLFFLSNRGASISANLVSRLLSQPLTIIQRRTSQQTLFAVTRGVEYVTLQILAPSLVLVSDAALLMVMGVGLFLVDPWTAILTFVIFFGIGFALYKFMHVEATKLGIRSSELNIRSNEKIVEVFSSYRESLVRNRRDFYAREIARYRFDLARTSAELSFLPYVSKYVIETSVVLGALVIGLFQFYFQDTAQAVTTLAIFLAAGTRIAPAVLRVQQGTVLIRGSLGQATPTLDLIEELGDELFIENVIDQVNVKHEGFISEVVLSDVTYTYPNNLAPSVSNVSINIPAGKSVAIVGTSGAGKTTIVDLLLGVLPVNSGSVRISGCTPEDAVKKWPGAISYVPQDVAIAAGTIRENIAMGYPLSEATDELIKSAIQAAQLESFIENLHHGLDTQVGERGVKISGGERQRLGIARAMFTRPHLLVLDEATSSLDGETESHISKAISSLRGSTTVVMIAHRLSTVRNADIVIYMDKGKIIAEGTFEEVRQKVPKFDNQAKLMGL